MSTIIKVLLVDDHELVRSGIKGLLANISDIKVLGEADNGEHAIQMAAALKPDVILMDLVMPVIGGVEASQRILESQQNVKIIILTSQGSEPLPTRLLQTGVAGYLTKGCALEEMVQAIHRVYLGQRYISPDIAQHLALKKVHEPGELEASPFNHLSGRELQIMQMITRGQKVPDIADELGLSLKTVNTYRYRLFEKLKVKNDVELTHLAIRYGQLDAPTE